jgi:histidinol-phosphate aminotransferase
MKNETLNPEKLLRQDLADFPPYSMGHVPLADLDRIVKLDLNENSFGPSPKAIAALADMHHYHRYVGQDELRQAIANYVGVDVSHIVTSNGADEMIDLVQRMFLDRGDAIVDCSPSFEMYRFFARLNGARVIDVPREDDFSIDLDGIERVIKSHHLPSSRVGERMEEEGSAPKFIFLANPSNPDGSCASRDEIERLLALPVILVLDEAYAEFAGETYAGLVPTQLNLVVLRSFSKWAGLAGLRIGYCIAPSPIAAKILQCKSPENVNAAGIVAARASLDDKEYLLGNVRRIVDERRRLSKKLAELKYIHPLPSQANFILCRVIGRDAKQIQRELESRRILIRAFGTPRLQNHIRISVGTPEQDNALLSALSDIGRE